MWPYKKQPPLIALMASSRKFSRRTLSGGRPGTSSQGRHVSNLLTEKRGTTSRIKINNVELQFEK